MEIVTEADAADDSGASLKTDPNKNQDDQPCHGLFLSMLKANMKN